MPYKLGTTLLGMQTMAQIAAAAGIAYLPDPKSTFKPYAVQVPLANGAARGMGLPVATWDYGYLTQAQRDVLRAYCTGVSATVYIETRKTDSADAFTSYQATMMWPEVEERDALRRVNFSIRFVNLTPAS